MKRINAKDSILVKVRSGFRFHIPIGDRDKVKEGDWVLIIPIKYIKASEMLGEGT